MAQMTESLARAILNGAGVTRNELEQLARCWISNHLSAQANVLDDTASFKNFHRSLCERFGYTHDDVHWRRDLVSLEEHIANVSAQANVRVTDEAVKSAFDRYWDVYWTVSPPKDREMQRNKDGSMSTKSVPPNLAPIRAALEDFAARLSQGAQFDRDEGSELAEAYAKRFEDCCDPDAQGAQGEAVAEVCYDSYGFGRLVWLKQFGKGNQPPHGSKLYTPPAPSAEDTRDAARWRHFVSMVDPVIVGRFTVYKNAYPADDEQICDARHMTEIIDQALAAERGEA